MEDQPVGTLKPCHMGHLVMSVEYYAVLKLDHVLSRCTVTFIMNIHSSDSALKGQQAGIPSWHAEVPF